MNILGLTTMTESSAVLLQSGVLVAAAEEERFTRQKHAGGFPLHAIRFVLSHAGLTMRDVDAVAVYWDPWRLGHRLRYLLSLALKSPGLFIEKLRRAAAVWQGQSGHASGWSDLLTLRRQLQRALGSCPPLYCLDHHACHIASGFFSSPFESSAVLVMDGAGEDDCTRMALARGTSLQTLETHRLPHSLGHFYSAVTGYLGFKMLDGEYKLMGLSPYGDPDGARWIRRHLLTTPLPGRYRLEAGVLDYHRALRGHFDGPFVRQFGPPRASSDEEAWESRHLDVAASAQRAFEEVVVDLARALRQRTGERNLVIVGGCGLNGRANHRIVQEGIFESVFVPPAPHDAGAALGAAMLLSTRLLQQRPAPVLQAGLGPGIEPESARAALEADHIPILQNAATLPTAAGKRFVAWRLPDDRLVACTADAIAAGQVVAWADGPMEFGPRALGYRSFLADPRDARMVDILNAKIKKREPFRPFAPSVKVERAEEYFELGVPSPYMSFIAPVRACVRQQLAAVTHTDGTARPQTVEKRLQPRFWALLDAFEQRTGIPILLNTSLNIQEPIACTAADVLRTFRRSGADVLVLGEFFLQNRGTAHRDGWRSARPHLP